MVTVRVSSLVNGCTLIRAQSPASTVCALISSICSSVNSALYSHSSPRLSFIRPTVVSASTLLTSTSSGLLNSTEATSATNFLVASLTSTSPSVSDVFVSEFTPFSSAPSLATFSLAFSSPFSAITDPILPSFSSAFVSPIIPSISTRSVKLTNPPPGRLNWYILPFTEYSKSTVYTTP